MVPRVGRVVGGLLVWVDVFCHDFICVGVWNWRCMEYGDVFLKSCRLSVMIVALIQSLVWSDGLGRRCLMSFCVR